jgi:hypothetical protein
MFYIVIVLFKNQDTFSVTEILKNKYGVVLTFIIGIGLLILIINPGYYVKIMHNASKMPDWKRGFTDDVKLYSWVLRVESPVFFFLYPISALYVIKRFQKRIIHSIKLFGSIAMHSFVFAWKEERYMFIFILFILLARSID